MKIHEVTHDNVHIYLNLVQGYEAEFSVLTKKLPNKEGLYELDTEISGSNRGYILYKNVNPVGIAAINVKGNSEYEVCEFYIVPYLRKAKLGTQFAHGLWQSLSGKWEVKQIEGATDAMAFWRSCINSFPHTDFKEELYDDVFWGRVNRQTFVCS